LASFVSGSFLSFFDTRSFVFNNFLASFLQKKEFFFYFGLAKQACHIFK